MQIPLWEMTLNAQNGSKTIEIHLNKEANEKEEDAEIRWIKRRKIKASKWPLCHQEKEVFLRKIQRF